MVQFLLKLLLQQISCCAPRFPLIADCYKTAKLHSIYVKMSGVGNGNFDKVGAGVGVRHFGIVGETDILPPTPQPCREVCGTNWQSNMHDCPVLITK